VRVRERELRVSKFIRARYRPGDGEIPRARIIINNRRRRVSDKTHNLRASGARACLFVYCLQRIYYYACARVRDVAIESAQLLGRYGYAGYDTIRVARCNNAESIAAGLPEARDARGEGRGGGGETYVFPGRKNS